MIHKLYHKNYLGVFSAARNGQVLHLFIFAPLYWQIIFTFISDPIGHQAKTTNAKCKIRTCRLLFKRDIHVRVLKNSLHFFNILKDFR